FEGEEGADRQVLVDLFLFEGEEGADRQVLVDLFPEVMDRFLEVVDLMISATERELASWGKAIFSGRGELEARLAALSSERTLITTLRDDPSLFKESSSRGLILKTAAELGEAKWVVDLLRRNPDFVDEGDRTLTLRIAAANRAAREVILFLKGNPDSVQDARRRGGILWVAIQNGVAKEVVEFLTQNPYFVLEGDRQRILEEANRLLKKQEYGEGGEGSSTPPMTSGGSTPAAPVAGSASALPFEIGNGGQALFEGNQTGSLEGVDLVAFPIGAALEMISPEMVPLGLRGIESGFERPLEVRALEARPFVELLGR
ncbi:MAG: hypothetical protein Q7S00_01575, partial [bacterium]|nr:hypothetical protein [bacterium]